MNTLAKLNEFNHAEDSPRRLLERLGWAYFRCEELAAEQNALLTGQVRIQIR